MKNRRGITPSQRPELLVLGYGNELRSDDGIGPLVARAVAAWQLPHVRGLALQQLLPELAASIAQARWVVFVDACLVSDQDRALRLHAIAPRRTLSALGHSNTPEELSAMARALYGGEPRCWTLPVPVCCLKLGQALSPIAKRSGRRALQLIRALAQHCEGAPHA